MNLHPLFVLLAQHVEPKAVLLHIDRVEKVAAKHDPVVRPDAALEHRKLNSDTVVGTVLGDELETF